MELPNFVIAHEKKFVIISTISSFGTQEMKVTQKDLIDYFKKERNAFKTLKSLSGVFGDWRNMDNIADFCMNYFLNNDHDEFVELCKKEQILTE